MQVVAPGELVAAPYSLVPAHEAIGGLGGLGAVAPLHHDEVAAMTAGMPSDIAPGDMPARLLARGDLAAPLLARIGDGSGGNGNVVG